jgi:uncharacterized Fe-S cluster protein YjdI
MPDHGRTHTHSPFEEDVSRTIAASQIGVPTGLVGMATRDYVGIGVTVHWDGDRCFHSERCMKGLPTVFDEAARPWVTLDGADAAAVAAVIDTCPSGALSYTRTDGAPNGRRGRAANEDPAASVAADRNWRTQPVAFADPGPPTSA